MRKSTLFISTVLTTFALVMLYRVALAFRDNGSAAEVAAAPTVVLAPTATLEPTATEPPAPTEVVLGPEEAAQLAAQVVGNTNLLSAESSNLNGVDAYLITFANNDIVYVGLDGEILGVQVAPVVVNVAPPVKQKNRNNNNGGGGENENHEEHEEHDDEHDD